MPLKTRPSEPVGPSAGRKSGERVETAVRTAGPQTLRQRLLRLTKQGARQVVGGTSEIGVVQNVEELARKRSPTFSVRRNARCSPRSAWRSVETSQYVASKITLLALWRRSESRRIEDLAARISRTLKNKRHSRNYVRPRIEGGAISLEHSAHQINRRSGSGPG